MTRPPDPLDASEVERYGRHLLLPELGMVGQRRLKASSVLLIGAGGLGSPAALYLAAAGVGRITLVDPDVVDVSNLHRQVLHGTRDAGRPKVESAADRLQDLNPHVALVTLRDRFHAGNALALAQAHDLVVDGSDSFATRYLASDACLLAGRPLVHASAYRFEGQATVLCTPGAPCYRCIYPSPPAPGEVPSCAEAGVLGVLPGILGTIQATEAVKLLAGIGESLAGRLLLVDALSMTFRTVKVRRDPGCAACGAGRTPKLEDAPEACAPPAPVPEIAPAELGRRLAEGPPVLLLDVREPQEWELGRIPGARLAPLSRLDTEIRELDRDSDVVVCCAAGVRSQRAGQLLVAAGFSRVRSLAGGVDRYAAEVDTSLDRG